MTVKNRSNCHSLLSAYLLSLALESQLFCWHSLAKKFIKDEFSLEIVTTICHCTTIGWKIFIRSIFIFIQLIFLL